METCRQFKTTMIFGINLLLCLALMGSYPGQAAAEEFDSIYADEINMVRGELVTLKVYSLTRVSVADPRIADIADADDEEILLVGQNRGETALFIWDEHGKRTIMVYVYNKNLDLVVTRTKRLLKDAAFPLRYQGIHRGN